MIFFFGSIRENQHLFMLLKLPTVGLCAWVIAQIVAQVLVFIGGKKKNLWDKNM